MIDEPLAVRGRGIDIDLGGEPDNDTADGGDARCADVPALGKESRYHPPVYVSATS
jgi:hypothetical protein